MHQSMTAVLCVLALVVGTVAAVRSTWSPCGLSMLSTITPFGERGRGHRYGATCTWFVLGATVGGIALGGVAAGLAALVQAAGPSATAVAAAALAATVVVAVSDSGLAGGRLPVHFRQVNERWLDAYRPWVYGAGFGFQIGCGLATYITTAAVYLTVVLAALTASPPAALGVGAAFGLVRGLAVLATRHLRTPGELLAFHQRFATWLPAADRVVLGSLAASAVVLVVVAGPVPAGLVVLGVAVGAGARRSVGRWRSAGQPVSVDPDPPVASVDAAAPTTSVPADGTSSLPSGGTGSGRLSRQRR